MKLAVTCLSEFIVSEHDPVPAHPPLQPVNCELGSGAAVRETDDPLEKLAEQAVLPPLVVQLIPAGALVTAPVPLGASTVTFAMNGPAPEPPVRLCW
jgi:hypothetical protein